VAKTPSIAKDSPLVKPAGRDFGGMGSQAPTQEPEGTCVAPTPRVVHGVGCNLEVELDWKLESVEWFCIPPNRFVRFPHSGCFAQPPSRSKQSTTPSRDPLGLSQWPPPSTFSNRASGCQTRATQGSISMWPGSTALRVCLESDGTRVLLPAVISVSEQFLIF